MFSNIYDIAAFFSNLTHSGICSCDDFEPHDTTDLCKSISLKYDEVYTNVLEKIRGNTIDEPLSCYTTYNILFPRKYHMNIVRGIETPYHQDPRKKNTKPVWAIQLIPLKNNLKLSLLLKKMRKLKAEKRPEDKGRPPVAEKHKISSPEGVIIPYIIKVNQTPFAKYTRRSSDYSITELGVVCGVYGRDSGLICNVYPNLDNLVKVFEIRFQSHKAIYGIVHYIISQIEKAESCFRFQSADYMNENGKCPLINECNPK